MNTFGNNDIEWKRLEQLCKRINFGELKVVIAHGKPVRVDAGIKQIKLDSPEDFHEGLDTVPM